MTQHIDLWIVTYVMKGKVYLSLPFTTREQAQRYYDSLMESYKPKGCDDLQILTSWIDV